MRPQGAALRGAMGCRCLHYWWWQGRPWWSSCRVEAEHEVCQRDFLYPQIDMNVFLSNMTKFAEQFWGVCREESGRFPRNGLPGEDEAECGPTTTQTVVNVKHVVIVLLDVHLRTSMYTYTLKYTQLYTVPKYTHKITYTNLHILEYVCR